MSAASPTAAHTVGAVVVDAAGEQIGVVAATALDPRRRTTEWLILSLDEVSTALPAFVASVRADGCVVLPFPGALVSAAPALSSTFLTQDLADALYDHYGLE